MAKLCDWIIKESSGSPIETVVIGTIAGSEYGDYGSEDIPGYAEHPRNKLLTWDEAIKYLDYDFDEGFGSAGCEAVYAWTKELVIFVSQYDGATSIESVPRNPVPVPPKMPGGG